MVENKKVIKDTLSVGPFVHLTNKCANCIISKNCEHYKKKFSAVLSTIKNELTKELEKIKNTGYYNEVEKYAKKREVKIKYKEKLAEKTQSNTQGCEYEKEIIQTTIKFLNDKYDINKNAHLISLIEQLIKLKLYDFRLMVGHGKLGMFLETDKGLTIVPGIHHSIDISKEIGSLMEQIDKIYSQRPDTVTNIQILNASEIFGKVTLPPVVDINEVE